MWVNAIMLVAILVQQFSPVGFIITTEEQSAFIVIVNMVLRAISSKGLV
jgi:hypothetical protein